MTIHNPIPPIPCLSLNLYNTLVLSCRVFSIRRRTLILSDDSPEPRRGVIGSRRVLAFSDLVSARFPLPRGAPPSSRSPTKISYVLCHEHLKNMRPHSLSLFPLWEKRPNVLVFST